MTLAVSRSSHRKSVMKATERSMSIEDKRQKLKNKWKCKKDRNGKVTWYRWNPYKLNSKGYLTGLGFWEKVK